MKTLPWKKKILKNQSFYWHTDHTEKKRYMDIHSISFSFEFCIDLNQIKKNVKKKETFINDGTESNVMIGKMIDFFFAFFFLIIIQKNKTPCVCQWNRCHYYYFVNFVWKNFCFQKFQKFAFSTLSLVGPGYIQKFLKLFSFKLDFHWKKKFFRQKNFKGEFFLQNILILEENYPNANIEEMQIWQTWWIIHPLWNMVSSKSKKIVVVVVCNCDNNNNKMFKFRITKCSFLEKKSKKIDWIFVCVFRDFFFVWSLKLDFVVY